MKRHRLAFVGLGRVADVHYASLLAMPDRTQLVAVCDTRPEAVAQRQTEWNVPGFADFGQLLQSVEVDAVCLFLPHHVHREFVATAVAHRKPIFLEKPIATTVEEAEAITRLCADGQVMLMVAHNGLFHPAFEQMAAFVRNGWLGRPLFARGTSAGWLTFRPWDFRLSREQTGGGCWIDAGGHLVYCLRELLGDVVDVTGYTAKLARPEMEGEDHAAATMKYRSGAMAHLFVSYGHKMPNYQHDWPLGYLNSIEVHGDRGSIEYVICPEPRLRYFSEVPEAMPPGFQGWLTHTPAEPYTSSFRYELAHFLDCLETGQRPRVTGEDATAVLRVLRALYESEAKRGS
jgi:predicted dehydrogenase